MLPDRSNTKLMCQKDIEREYGVPTRDILLALRKGFNFPKPVQVVGAKRWFHRADIVRFFKDRPSDRPQDRADPPAASAG